VPVDILCVNGSITITRDERLCCERLLRLVLVLSIARGERLLL
jgi:hypothetical protein